jgi:hypothetical protein
MPAAQRKSTRIPLILFPQPGDYQRADELRSILIHNGAVPRIKGDQSVLIMER